MMLAKTVLEEKSELLDRKEELIRGLRSHNKRLEGELEELRGESRRREGELIRLFQERYSLEVLNSAAGGIDPQIHQVVIAENGPQCDASLQVLRNGFRLEGKVIRPALVGVMAAKPPRPAAPASVEKVCTWKRQR
jgi:molecular chaperone GrpE (heat shock protein)